MSRRVAAIVAGVIAAWLVGVMVAGGASHLLFPDRDSGAAAARPAPRSASPWSVGSLAAAAPSPGPQVTTGPPALTIALARFGIGLPGAGVAVRPTAAPAASPAPLPTIWAGRAPESVVFRDTHVGLRAGHAVAGRRLRRLQSALPRP